MVKAFLIILMCSFSVVQAQANPNTFGQMKIEWRSLYEWQPTSKYGTYDFSVQIAGASDPRNAITFKSVNLSSAFTNSKTCNTASSCLENQKRSVTITRSKLAEALSHLKSDNQGYNIRISLFGFSRKNGIKLVGFKEVAIEQLINKQAGLWEVDLSGNRVDQTSFLNPNLTTSSSFYIRTIQ